MMKLAVELRSKRQTTDIKVVETTEARHDALAIEDHHLNPVDLVRHLDRLLKLKVWPVSRLAHMVRTSPAPGRTMSPPP